VQISDMKGFKKGKAGMSNKEALPMARAKMGRKKTSSKAHRLAKKLY
jgi:hypothetical protein